MAVWKAIKREAGKAAGSEVSPLSAPSQPLAAERDESRIAPALTIEGKIEGHGNVRMAGSFKGDVHVKGDLTIEKGARLNGNIRADAVVIAGEVEGNIHASSRIELKESGVLLGDLNADSLMVAAGSRMRGKAEFGWK